ncbi:unnamed protein product [Urochloa decumbens]|uniref:Uncharacterized protein n=1 Tax=Urochloa decumbens TaxID=240449 RepID=A0ABC9AP55_9POAL
MAHYQQGQHGQPATRVDEYGNPIPGGVVVQGQAGGYGAAGAGGYGQQAGYGPIGTGTHDVGGYGGSGQPAYGGTGTGVHDAGGLGGYGIHDARVVAGGHAGTHGVTGTGTHGTGYGTQGATGRVTGVPRVMSPPVLLEPTAPQPVPRSLMPASTRQAASSAALAAPAHLARCSSEDDGMGGRRKKGLKEKIKEKMPGGHTENQGQTATGAYGGTTGYTGTTGMGTTGGTYSPTTGGPHEKKGVMEKIKEKLPGGHKDHDQPHTTATSGYAPGRTGTTDTYGTTTTQGTHEKKGFMEKVKEKLPGQH